MKEIFKTEIYKPFLNVLSEETNDSELITALSENLEFILDNFYIENEKEEEISKNLENLKLPVSEYIDLFYMDGKIKQFLKYGSFFISHKKEIKYEDVKVKDIISVEKDSMKQFRNVGPILINYAEKYFKKNYNVSFN